MAGKMRPASETLRRADSRSLPRPVSALARDGCSPPRSRKLPGFERGGGGGGDQDADANLEIARTYFMEGVRMGAKGPDGREVVLQNFSVKINPEEVSDSPLCDYLRIYYR